MWTLTYFETSSGREPVKEYIDDLPPKERVRVTNTFELLEEYGTRLEFPHVKQIDGPLWELRIQGQRKHRIFYFADSGQRLVLLHAFTKQTRRTPPTEIETAKHRMAAYLGRIGQ
jgi:phage-related protein